MINWWHFSDIHWKKTKSSERERYIETLIQHLTDTQADEPPPDFIAITGDLSASGRREEYEELHERFITRLLGTVIRHSPPPILLIPGNHDLDRSKSKRNNPALITELTSQQAVDEFFDNPDNVQTFARPFNDFLSYQAELIPDLKASEDSHAFHWGRKVSVGTEKVYIHGANSAWASSYYADPHGEIADLRRLHLSETQINHQESEASLRILLVHHPLDWLSPHSELACRHAIEQQFDLVLCGHTHTAERISQSVSSRGRTVYAPAPVLHDRSDTDTVRYTRGFAFGRFHPGPRRVELRYFQFTDVSGRKIIEFAALYPPKQRCLSFDLSSRDAEVLATEANSEHVRRTNPKVQAQDRIVQTLLGREIHSHTLVSEFENACSAVLRWQEMAGPSSMPNAIECMLVAKLYLGALVQSSAKGTFDIRSTRQGFVDLVRAWYEDPAARPSLPIELIYAISQWSLEGEHPSGIKDSGIREHCLKKLPEPWNRYYPVFWLLASSIFFISNPVHAVRLITTDSRLKRLDAINETNHVGLLETFRFDDRDFRFVATSRVADRDGFFLSATILHYLDEIRKEITDIWRHFQRFLPPFRLVIEYPRLSSQLLRGDYLDVDTVPIIRLLMGKGLYGSQQHVWFRELIQNAFDACSTRNAFETEYKREVDIKLVSPSQVTIRDNGIGMTSTSHHSISDDVGSIHLDE